MRRGVWVLATAALTLTFGIRPTAAQPLTAITVVSPPAEEVTPVLYGIRSGIFRRLGLDVNLTFLNNGAAVAAAVIGGAAQFGSTSAFTAIVANARGIPIKVVAPSSVYTSTYPFGILVRKDSSIANAADLAGKTYATASLNDFSSLFLRAWIDSNGGNSQSVKAVEVPSSAMTAALAQGRVDAVTVYGAAQLAEALQSGTVRLLAKPMASVIGRNDKFVLGASFTTSAYAQANSGIVQAFVRGVLEANAYVNAHLSETAALVAEVVKTPVDIVARGDRLQFREVNDPKDLQPFVDLLVKYKIIDHPIAPSDLWVSSSAATGR